ncbi:TonB-dependent receptor domain-containing protein [Ferruginibacter yonginensis]|uniref:TonB-dependent receptor domain-containing protein n=1 Tax=Ferruginibacter yonginensis TaxID=1310416 RepID=A0ABV8QSK9_9BACT
MKSFILFLAFTTISLLSFAQKGKVEGKVTDSKTGQPLTGVSVIVKSTGKGVATDVEGRFTLNVEGAKKVSLVFSFNGVTQQIDEVEIIDGKVTTQNLSLTQREKTEDAVIVRTPSTARRETAASLITFQKNTNTVASVISAESIKRSPDRNTGEILKRTPGTSIQEGKFIIVRGLADRYNQAMLNGILLTSTEPDRKTFSFDLIPSQIIDNIIINKAFVPELPGEFAGGLIQVNTKDIPAKNFFNIQLGTGFNTQTTGKSFYRDAQGGKLDWLGVDDGTRALPDLYTTKSNFDTLSRSAKTAIGKALRNSWSPEKFTAPVNGAFQLNGGFVGKLFGKKIGGAVGINYNRNYRFQDLMNTKNVANGSTFSKETSYEDDKYLQETVVGGIASLSLQLNNLNKVSVKALVNVNNANAITNRLGYDSSRPRPLQKGTEFTFKQNTFFTTQINGEHGITKDVKFKWYGAFNILDGYVPDQRRLLYERETVNNNYEAVIANSLSQQSGSRVYQSLSDYIYTGGGDVSYNFNAFGSKQTVKAGYMFQIKDRIYDAQLFANYLPTDNATLRLLSPDKIFAPENFGNGFENKFAFDAIKNRNFRYIANTILNAGFVQFDNAITKSLRVVWGLRIEDYDQLIGSVKKFDSRHTYSRVRDYLPGVNFTYKLNSKTNIRLTGSQTVIRPELRELSALNLYDFELNASVQGQPTLKRTKIFNTDLRYELYPRAGEVFSVGVFYKNFKDPIEQIFNEGAGGASTFNFRNPKSAYAYGVELELRKKLDAIDAFKNFTFQSNVSFIKSKVSDDQLKVNRPLQGQSDYVINAGLLYDIEKIGLNVTTLFNIIGKRIYVVGDNSAAAGTPDVWEAPRPLLDMQIAKKIIKSKGELRLSASDILNQKQIFYQNNTTNGSFGLDKKVDAYRFTRVNGTTFSLTFNYTL